VADRYWVGGTGSWDATTTNWSASSGGAGGASVPTSVDDVFFDTLSNLTAYTCTLTTSPVCRSVSVAGPASGNVTIAGNTPWVIYGSFTLAATGVTITFSYGLYFNATTTGWTVTTNGISLPCALQFQAFGGWSLGSALTTTNFIAVNIGTFSTANFNITTTGTFSSLGTTYARTINLGSSAISCLTWNALGATNLTVNAGTSTITVTQAAGTFNGGGLTYYNVYKAANGFAIGDGGNTFNALTNATMSVSGTCICSFAGNQTIGTLTVNGGSGGSGITGRSSIQTPSTLAGTQITLTVASFVTNGFVDFRDINFQGAASPLTVATGGDCGNNTYLILQTPKTVYWSLVSGGNWSSNAWATSSGGTPNIANYPLPQDTVIIDNTGLTSGNTITMNVSPNLGTIDMSTRTLPMTFAMVNLLPIFYGDLKFSSSVTTTGGGTSNFIFSGYNKTQTITTSGITLNSQVSVGGLSTIVTFADALNTTYATNLNLGTLNLNNKNLTCGYFNSISAATRVLTFGTGQIYVTAASSFSLNMDNMTGFTYTGTGVFNWTYSGSVGTRGCSLGNSGGGTESNALTVNITAGTDLVSIYGSGLKNVNFTGFSGTLTDAGNLYLYGDLTFSSAMSFSGTFKNLFFQSSGVQNITSNGRAFPLILYFQGTGTYNLLDALTTTYYFNHYTGTLNLNNFTLTAGSGNSNAVTTRAINFGTGSINLTGNNQTIFNANNTTGLTVTGSATINFTYSGSVGTRNYLGYGAGSALFNFNVTAGSDIVSTTNYGVNNLNFTGFTGSTAGFYLVGSLTLGAGMTISTATGSALGGSGTITSNGVLFDSPLTIASTGTYTLQDALTVGSTRTFTLSQGTLNLNGKTATTGLFASTGSSVRSISFNGGTIITSGATFTASGTNLTTSGTGTISMTSASSKTFAGGGFSYPTLNQGGAGALVITGANTFRTIANTVAPATITLPVSTITSIAGFDLIGSAGNLITLNSSTSGTQATINNTTGGIIGGNYLSYQDINATPASTISAGANSTSVSNNTGWLTTPVASVAIAESFSLYVPVTFKANSTFSGAPFGSVPIVGGIDITFNMYDYFQAFLDQFGTTTESITLSDTQVSQAGFNPTNAESLTLTDAQSTQVAFAPTNAETLTLTNTQSSQVSFVSTNAESITVADAQAGIRGQFGTTAEAITFTNTQAALAAFAPQVAELLTLTELISIQSNLVGYTAETIVFTDTQIQRGWIKIINSQTPNWTNINDYQ